MRAHHLKRGKYIKIKAIGICISCGHMQKLKVMTTIRGLKEISNKGGTIKDLCLKCISRRSSVW